MKILNFTLKFIVRPIIYHIIFHIKNSHPDPVEPVKTCRVH